LTFVEFILIFATCSLVLLTSDVTVVNRFNITWPYNRC